MNERLSLRPGASRWLGATLGATHAAAAAGLLLAPLALPWGVVGSLGLAAHLIQVLRRHVWRIDTESIVGLDLAADGSVRACTLRGEWADFRIAGSSFSCPFLAIVVLLPSVPGSRTQAVLLPSDTLDAESFRRLRVWLLWRFARTSGRPPPAAGP